MDISIKECVSEKTANVLYAYGKQTTADGSITKIKYYNPSSKSIHWMTVSDISKKLLGGEVFVYAGKYDSKSDSFINVVVVIPMIKDGEYYITSVTDDKKTNNLENLPLYDK